MKLRCVHLLLCLVLLLLKLKLKTFVEFYGDVNVAPRTYEQLLRFHLYDLLIASRRSSCSGVLCSCNSLYLSKLFILLLSGDVHLNPGPTTRYPCGMCSRPVR